MLIYYVPQTDYSLGISIPKLVIYLGKYLILSLVLYCCI
eukprot:UN10189